MSSNNRKFIHHGSNSFDIARWNPIKNAPFERSFVKPSGGLWASPVDAELSWEKWCQMANFNTKRLSDSFEFELTGNARILKITSMAVVQSLPQIKDNPIVDSILQRYSKIGVPFTEIPIDFEELSKEYDVIEFLASEFFCPSKILSGWDCDCILVLNSNVIT